MARQKARRTTASGHGIRSSSDKITKQEERFCELVAMGTSGSEAVRQSWPKWRNKSPQACAVKASNLMATKEKIRDRIEKLKAIKTETVNKKFEVTLVDVLNEVAKLAFANMGDFVRPTKEGGLVGDFSNITRDQMAAIASLEMEQIQATDDEGKPIPGAVCIKAKPKLADKLGALKVLGGHLGLKSRVEVGGPDGGPIQVEDKSQRSDTDIARRIAFMLTSAAKEISG